MLMLHSLLYEGCQPVKLMLPATESNMLRCKPRNTHSRSTYPERHFNTERRVMHTLNATNSKLINANVHKNQEPRTNHKIPAPDKEVRPHEETRHATNVDNPSFHLLSISCRIGLTSRTGFGPWTWPWPWTCLWATPWVLERAWAQAEAHRTYPAHIS